MKVCVECKEKEARHWSSSFCEDCFSKLLNEKFKEDEEKKNEHTKR